MPAVLFSLSGEARVGVRRKRVVGGRPHSVKVRFTDEELGTVSAMAAQAGVSVPDLLVTSVLGLSGPDVRAVVEEMAAVRRYLEVCAAGLAAGAEVGLVGMVEDAVVRLRGILDEVEMLLPRSVAVSGPGAASGDDVLGGGVVVVTESGGDDGGGSLEDELPER